MLVLVSDNLMISCNGPIIIVIVVISKVEHHQKEKTKSTNPLRQSLGDSCAIFRTWCVIVVSSRTLGVKGRPISRIRLYSRYILPVTVDDGGTVRL